MSSATLSELLDMLDNGAFLLFPNARAAREIRLRFDARQRERGLTAWDSAQVLSWSQWTRSHWSDLVVAGFEDRLLLNRAQEQSLWREIITQDAASETYGSADSLTELATTAWQLAADYNVTRRLREFASTYDSRIFAEWAEAFSKQCATKAYLSTALLDAALMLHVEAATLPPPKALRMVGFGKLSPSQQSLLAALCASGTQVEELSLQTHQANSFRASVVAATESDELATSARWIRNLLEHEPTARIAVLVPNLAEARAELTDVLRETLAPELQSIDADLSSTPWEFSSGDALSSLAMIGDALALARWQESPLPTTVVSSLLLSPYLGHNVSDRLSRDMSSIFDTNKLRRNLLLRPEIDLSSVIELASTGKEQTSAHPSPMGWLKNMHEFMQRAGDRTRPRSFAEWMEYIRALIQSANWPGDRPLTPLEFEAIDAWESTLDLVSTLDFSGRRVSYSSALNALELLLKSALVASPSVGAPVQIMDVTEAEGSIFDAVVFLRCTEKWPAIERMNPVLPWALQRSLRMPGSDPSSTSANALQFLENLLSRSGSVLFTSSAEDDSGALRPSPLLAKLGIERSDLASFSSPALPYMSVELETAFDDERIPALPTHEIPGGSAVLKLQAACGFLAFAQLRLQAKELHDAEIGLDAGESGGILHRALQYFWKLIKTQDKLRSMSWQDRHETLTTSIDQALPSRLRIRNEWDREYIAMLKQRLHSVLQRWLDEELRRGPFEISDVEREELVTIGPLTLNVRIDRIDSVGDGLFFVDYKTGYEARPKQWEGERPDDPQLPLYALLPEAHELKGVAFARVRAGRDMKWVGLQSEEGILPLSRSKANVQDLDPLVHEWRQTLTRLAEDFAAGNADVHPKSFAINCARCAQRLLCRLDPASLLSDVDEGEEEDIDG